MPYEELSEEAKQPDPATVSAISVGDRSRRIGSRQHTNGQVEDGRSDAKEFAGFSPGYPRAEDEPVGKRGTFAARSGLAALAAALMAENCTHELPGLVIAVGHGVGTIHGGSCRRFRSPQASGLRPISTRPSDP